MSSGPSNILVTLTDLGKDGERLHDQRPHHVRVEPDGDAPFTSHVLFNRDGSVAYVSAAIDPDAQRSAIELALRP